MKRACLLLVLSSTAYADELANSPIRAGYEPTGRLFDFEERRKLDHENGFDPMITYVGESFWAPQLDDRRIAAGGLLVLEVDLAMDKLIGDGWGAAYISGIAVHGNSVSDELMDVHGVSSNAAPEDVRLFEAWLEQPIGALTLRAGILAADQEYVLAEHASTLVNATFGMTAQLSANVGNPFYPVGTPGASGHLEIEEHFGARLGVFDGTQANTHGIPDDLGPDVLVIGELEVGPVTVGGYDHDKLGRGTYAIADKQVTDEFGGFARIGFADGPIARYIDAGIRANGFREHDLISAGIAYASTATGPQIVAEATYEAQIGWLTVQPDAQLVLLRDRTVGVLGVRATVVF